MKKRGRTNLCGILCSSLLQLHFFCFRSGTCSSVIGSSEAIQMTTQSIVMLTVTILTMVYLLYALLRPEKF